MISDDSEGGTAMSDRSTVAVLGTGIMGLPMARNLLAAGFGVRAWNRTRSKAEPLAGHGATVVDTPAEAVAGADLVLTMLADGPAVQGVMSQLVDAGDRPDLWIQASTVGVEWTERLAGTAGRLGMAFVDAPVLGSRGPAEQGALIVLASGPEEARRRCAPVFDAIGGRTVEVGEAGSASRLKLVVNSWVLTLTVGTAEALALAGSLGLDPELFLKTIDGTPTDSPYAHLKGAGMLSGDPAVSFPLSLAAKDAQLVTAAAAGTGLELPLASAVRSRFERADTLGHGPEDMGAVYRAYRAD